MIALYTSSISLVKGGIENTSYLLCKGLSGYDSIIAAPLSITDELKDLNVDVLDYNIRKKFFKYLFLFKEHLKKGGSIQYSLCLTWKYAVIPYLIKRISGRPYGVMMHGSDLMPISNTSGLRLIILSRLRNVILKNATQLFANSLFTLELLKKDYADFEAEVIHPPIIYDIPFKSEKNKKQYVLFSIGRIETRKGFQDCIEAVKLLKYKYPNLEYRIAGTGPYLEDLKKLVEDNGLESSVRFLGRISEEEKIIQYCEADIVLMPSRTEISSIEGFGIVFVEANMCGCPSLGSRSGGISDAIIDKKTGWIVNEKSPNEIAEIIDDIYSNRKSLDIDDLYSWGMKHSYQNISREYIKHIKKAIGKVY